ncbi:MAG: hypothetical protein AAGI38_11295 [Bacteroidota bacterium]
MKHLLLSLLLFAFLGSTACGQQTQRGDTLSPALSVIDLVDPADSSAKANNKQNTKNQATAQPVSDVASTNQSVELTREERQRQKRLERARLQVKKARQKGYRMAEREEALREMKLRKLIDSEEEVNP